MKTVLFYLCIILFFVSCSKTRTLKDVELSNTQINWPKDSLMDVRVDCDTNSDGKADVFSVLVVNLKDQRNCLAVLTTRDTLTGELVFQDGKLASVWAVIRKKSWPLSNE